VVFGQRLIRPERKGSGLARRRRVRLWRKNKNNMACTYVLYSKTTDKRYIGSSREDTANVRLSSHNSGKTRSTKYGRPWVILYEEKFKDFTTARKREIFLKSGVGRKWMKEILGD